MWKVAGLFGALHAVGLLCMCRIHRELLRLQWSIGHLHYISRRRDAATQSVAKCDAQTQSVEEHDFIHVRLFDDIRTTIFENILARHLTYDKKIVLLDDSLTVNEAVQRLSVEQTTIALVSSRENGIIGILDTPDVIRYVLRRGPFQLGVSSMLRKCVLADDDASVKEIVAHLRSGVRYIAINVGPKFEIVSQRAIIALVFDQMEQCPHLMSLGQRTVGDLGLATRRPLRCSLSANAADAFESMAAYSITSLPIVDEHDEARGVISATDIFFACRENDTLALGVAEYVQKSRAWAGIRRDVADIISCAMTDRLVDVLKRMLTEHVHHIYVIDQGTPIGVVSFVDVIRLL